MTKEERITPVHAGFQTQQRFKMSDQHHHMHMSQDQTSKLLESGDCISRDSGFLSGALTTESDLSCSQISSCDLAASTTSSSSIPHHQQQSFQRLDSGVDVSLDQLSQLNLSTDDPKLLLPSQQSSSQSNTSKQQLLPLQSLPPWEFFFTPDDEGDTRLHDAILEGLEEVAFTIISLVPHPSILDLQNDYCQTPLHVAVLMKMKRVARRLVAAGARVDIRDRNGNTALHLSCSQGDLSSVQALTTALTGEETLQCQLKYPAFAQTTLPQQLDLRNYDGQAPIHLAALGGHCDVIRALHWLGTDLNATDGKGGRTALHYAVERGLESVVRCLVGECNCNLEIETYGGHTAYQLATEQSNNQLAETLQVNGAITHPMLMDDEDDESDFSDNEEIQELPQFIKQ